MQKSRNAAGGPRLIVVYIIFLHRSPALSADREMLFFLSAERQTRLMGAFSSSLAAFHTPLRPSPFFAARNTRRRGFYRDLYSRSRSSISQAFCAAGPMYCFFVINSVCDNVMRWHFSF